MRVAILGVAGTIAPATRSRSRGVLPPEQCVDPDDLFPELERKGCVFT